MNNKLKELINNIQENDNEEDIWEEEKQTYTEDEKVSWFSTISFAILAVGGILGVYGIYRYFYISDIHYRAVDHGNLDLIQNSANVMEDVKVLVFIAAIIFIAGVICFAFSRNSGNGSKEKTEKNKSNEILHNTKDTLYTKLKELKSLRDENLISEDEYEEIRKKVINTCKKDL